MTQAAVKASLIWKAAKDIESLEVGRIVPIYESAANAKLTSRWFRRIIHGALENLAADIPDGIPPSISRRLDLLDRRPAFAQVHFPPEGESFAELQNHATPAHKRLIFEELFFLEVGLELKRRKMRERPGIAFALTESSSRGAQENSAVQAHRRAEARARRNRQ